MSTFFHFSPLSSFMFTLSHPFPPRQETGKTVARCSLFHLFRAHRKFFSWASVQVSSFCLIKTSFNLAFHLQWWSCRCPSHACDAPIPSTSSEPQGFASTWPWEHTLLKDVFFSVPTFQECFTILFQKLCSQTNKYALAVHNPNNRFGFAYHQLLTMHTQNKKSPRWRS